MPRGACLLLLVPLAACEWIDDEEDRERRDNDEDGLPMTLDCNDRRPGIGELPDADRVLGCGEEVSATVSGTDRLEASTCLHPVGSGDELAMYAEREDLWQLTVPNDGEVEVRLVPGAGFSQRSTADEELDQARIVLWAWPEGECPREHCHLGFPLAGPGGALDEDVRVRFDAVAEEDWTLVVTAAVDAPYTLVVDCP